MQVQDKQHCFRKCESIGGKVGLLARVYARINFVGLRLFGKAWLPQYLGPLYPMVIAHNTAFSLKFWNAGHHENFSTLTGRDGFHASEYFARSGIAELAEKNGGLCSFWMNGRPALYQTTNLPLVRDEFLAPSTGPNRHLFGDFMGTLAHESELRKAKQKVFLTTFGSPKFCKTALPHLLTHAESFFGSCSGVMLSLEEFALRLVAHVDSQIPGLLDALSKPLNAYLDDERYGYVLRNFFQAASDVISKLDSRALSVAESIVPFVRDLVQDNYESIAAAPASNIILQHFALHRQPFTRDGVAQASPEMLKELGVALVATFDTTALSLYWALSYIENDPQIRDRVAACAAQRCDCHEKSFSCIELVVLEATRMGGSNPTALWREVVRPFSLSVDGCEIWVRPGTMLWLDRWRANRDAAVFPRPMDFSPDNIETISTGCPSVSAFLARGRYEINSFSMINTEKNPRKCPGRLFSVVVQSALIRALYANYDVDARGISVDLRRFSSMPRPAEGATVRIDRKPRTEVHSDA